MSNNRSYLGISAKLWFEMDKIPNKDGRDRHPLPADCDNFEAWLDIDAEDDSDSTVWIVFHLLPMNGDVKLPEIRINLGEYDRESLKSSLARLSAAL